ncbi:MAG TPA: hypothetical protein VJV75_01430 [Candidatus Polarisedimenticolia bacterium]|nr:hypothetical protein [Candidatus Polarisedimenticolia bacterium]
MRALILALAAAAALVACASNSDDESGSDGGTGVLCPLWIAPGVMIEVHDASTGEPAACDTKGIAESTGEIQTLDPATPCSMNPTALTLSGITHIGLWNLTIEKAGYKPWRLDGVQVMGGVCGLIPVQLRADLEPI